MAGEDIIISLMDETMMPRAAVVIYKLITFGDIIRISFCSKYNFFMVKSFYRKLYKLMGSKRILNNFRVSRIENMPRMRMKAPTTTNTGCQKFPESAYVYVIE
jgi:hypothetical protein